MTISTDQVFNEAKQSPEYLAEFAQQRTWYELQRSITQARKNKGMTQSDIAEAMHTTKSAISRLENSERFPNLKTLNKMAEVLGCHLEVKLVPNR